MILKALLALTLTNVIYAEEEKSIKELMEEMYKSQIEMEAIMEEDLVEENSEDIYFPDDSYVGLKCTRDRASVAFGWDKDALLLNVKDDLGRWYHKPYVNVEYFTISPSQKKGMVVYWFNYWRNVDTDMYKFNGEEYSKNAPYESEKFVVNEYSYVINFKNSSQIRFNREDLSFGFPGINPPKMGSCEILETDDFFEDIDSRYEKLMELKERNQQIIDAKKAKLKF